MQTRRLAASFETFTRSVEHTGPEKFPCKATWVKAFFFENLWKQPDAKELTNHILFFSFIGLLFTVKHCVTVSTLASSISFGYTLCALWDILVTVVLFNGQWETVFLLHDLYFFKIVFWLCCVSLIYNVWLLHDFLLCNYNCRLHLSSMCMTHLFICVSLNSSCTAWPLSSVFFLHLFFVLLWTLFNIVLLFCIFFVECRSWIFLEGHSMIVAKQCMRRIQLLKDTAYCNCHYASFEELTPEEQPCTKGAIIRSVFLALSRANQSC